MAEEHIIIKRKLLFDGAGVGDDRRINLLQKMLINWILTDYGSYEDNATMFNKILLQLGIIEHSRHKSELVRLRNDRQLQQYKDYQMEIENAMASIREVIDTSKFILAKVKCEKHQKLNYDMIAKDIVKQPSRIETSKSVQQLQQEINNMKNNQQKLKNEFNMWRKHFIVLSTSANEMFTKLNESTVNDLKTTSPGSTSNVLSK